MNKQYLFTLIIALLTTIGALAQSKFSGGTGTVDAPFLISNQADLEMLANDVTNGSNNYSGKYLKLIRDIKLTDGTNWQPIGGGDKAPFDGLFDGDGHKITNLFIDRPNTMYNIGLFGITGHRAVIQNFGVEIASGGVTGNQRVGGLAGGNFGTISNCYVTGYVEGNMDIGGLVGVNSSKISNCYVTGNVKGRNGVGGLVGRSSISSEINNCYTTCNVEGIGTVGGLIATNGNTVNNCYATGNVEGKETVGGLAGVNQSTISNSYATGNVTGKENVGRLVGYKLNSSTIVNCDSIDVAQTVQNRQDTEVAATPSTFSGSAGTADNPFLISNQTDLEQLATDINSGANNYSGKYLKLTQDIKLSDGTNWRPIGRSGDYRSFSGTFDGDGHKITNLFIDRPNIDHVGFFGITGESSAIQNLGIEIASGGVTGIDFVGGLAGSNSGTISNCYVTGDVKGNLDVGGLVGVNEFTINNCCATGNIKSKKDAAGGLVGLNRGTISNCYATGDVEGQWHIGGLEGKWYVGGIVGGNVTGTISNSYYNSVSAHGKGIGYTRSDFDDTPVPGNSLLPIPLIKMATEGLGIMENLTKGVGADQWNDGNSKGKDCYLPAPKPFKKVSKVDPAKQVKDIRKRETALEKEMKKINVSINMPSFLIASQNEDLISVTEVTEKDPLPTIAQSYRHELSYGATFFKVLFGNLHSIIRFKGEDCVIFVYVPLGKDGAQYYDSPNEQARKMFNANVMEIYPKDLQKNVYEDKYTTCKTVVITSKEGYRIHLNFMLTNKSKKKFDKYLMDFEKVFWFND
ncbi:hypothetical protein AGMMS50239_26880 [Bacteroidia bacterium]|nr:hypothetical protein AGMMS50239_26880 [Bacteroidia bacterium]